MFAGYSLFIVFFALLTAARSPQCRAMTTMLPSSPASSWLDATYTIASGETFAPEQDFTLYDRGSSACEDQSEGGDSAAVFVLEEEATLSNVIISANQAEGIHCLGSCTLYNVWFEDVCEDAITIEQVTFVLPWGTSFMRYVLTSWLSFCLKMSHCGKRKSRYARHLRANPFRACTTHFFFPAATAISKIVGHLHIPTLSHIERTLFVIIRCSELHNTNNYGRSVNVYVYWKKKERKKKKI